MIASRYLDNRIQRLGNCRNMYDARFSSDQEISAAILMYGYPWVDV